MSEEEDPQLVAKQSHLIKDFIEVRTWVIVGKCNKNSS